MLLFWLPSLAGGCVWRGYIPPDAASIRPVDTYPPCPAVGVQNLSPERGRIIVEAAAQVCAVFRSDAFRDRLAAETLRESCAAETRIAGSQLHAVLLAELPGAYSVVARKPWLAEAVTDPVNNRIAIRLNRFNGWARGGAARAPMIDTLAHELTHLVRSETGSRFQDRGHGRACPKTSLVSYRVGRLAAEIWRSHFMNRAT